MNNDERIIKYLEGELSEAEKVLFEKELSDSEALRNELYAYKKVLTEFDEQKSFETDAHYFNSIIPKAREKLERKETINPFRKISFAAAFILILVAGYFLFQPLFFSSSENILTIEELANNMTDAELDEMIDYLLTEDETELIDEDIYNFEEDDLENIIYASTYENKLAIISDFGINDFSADIPETEKEEIYNELINKNFSSEVNL